MEDYTLIKNGAQELDGKWKLAEYLGTEQEDGTINRSLLPTEQVELSLRILKRRKLHGNSLNGGQAKMFRQNTHTHYVQHMVRHISGYQPIWQLFTTIQWMKLTNRLY